MRVNDPLTGAPEVRIRRRRSIFTIIGMIVVAIVAAIVVYYAYHGWRDKGQPLPEVKKTTMVSPAGGSGLAAAWVSAALRTAAA